MNVVYRCEGKDGVGPYRHYNYWELAPQFLRDHNDDLRNHPMPYKDNFSKLPARENNFVCGFINEEQLNSWFPKNEQKALVELGFIFAKYECEEVYIGDHQCIFNRQTAKLVEEIKI